MKKELLTLAVMGMMAAGTVMADDEKPNVEGAPAATVEQAKDGANGCGANTCSGEMKKEKEEKNNKEAKNSCKGHKNGCKGKGKKKGHKK